VKVLKTQVIEVRYARPGNAGARFRVADSHAPFPFVQIVHILVAAQQKMH
jgi:hypothetical protein